MRNLLLLLILALAASCSTTRTVPEGEYLYTGAEVTVNTPDSTLKTKNLQSQLAREIKQRTNRKILGMPIRLWVYNSFGQKSGKKNLGNWIQNTIGEAPKLYDPDATRQIAVNMENQLFNKGFFYPEVKPVLDTTGKKAKVNYEARVLPPYRIDSIQIALDNQFVQAAMRDYAYSEQFTTGKTYQLEVLKQERERISTHLREEGFYYFQPDYLQFVADTMFGERQILLRMEIKEEVEPQFLQPAVIDSIIVFPDFKYTQTGRKDTIVFQDIVFKYNQLPVNPKVIVNSILVDIGDRYSPTRHRNTLGRLSNLSAYRFVNITYDAPPDHPEKLIMQVYLSESTKHSIEGTAGISWASSNYLGPEVTLTYTNRNTFRGSEKMRIYGRGNFNFPLAGAVNTQNYFEEIKGGVEVTRPRIFIPFAEKRKRGNLLRAETNWRLEYERERFRNSLDDPTLQVLIQFFQLTELQEGLARDSTFSPFIAFNTFRFSFGYRWQRQKTIVNELNPLVFEYQPVSFETNDLKTLFQLASAFSGDLESLFYLEDMVLYRPEYTFIYDSRLKRKKVHNYFYRGRISPVVNRVLPDNTDDQVIEFFNNYYVRGENDFRYFLRPGDTDKHTLAFRQVVDITYPLGSDGVFVPFADLYSVGGPNSVRAFRPLDVGPGVTGRDESQVDVLRGKGDIHIEASFEYRYRLTQLFELAAFVDAGNVWLYPRGDQDNDVPGTFRFNKFYQQLAAGTGAGVRLNFGYLVLRLDLAFPINDPARPEGERWVLDNVGFSDANFSLAFGYPF